ncbi:hypothetical protein TWF481_002476 [Arthrobotrys musiformis]|uniref:Uncharacterized protein n=1 Tax=Arthrobotrys musiformis TaxID=47236 RepID=A0AAV9VVB9_9PEZI
MSEFFPYPTTAYPKSMNDPPPPRPSRRRPHQERGVSSIVEWLWNIYAQRKVVDLEFWFKTSLNPWLRIHRRKVHQIRTLVAGKDKHNDDAFGLSWEDPRMKDPVLYSFRWYELFIALMTVAVRAYQEEIGLNLEPEDIRELEMDGTIYELDKSVEYSCHHVKVAIEILECLEEDYLRNHDIAAIYINALNEASVYVLRLYGYGDWIGPITDSKIEGDPIGTFLSWFQQPFSVIRARNGIDDTVMAARAQRLKTLDLRNRFGKARTQLLKNAIQMESIESPPITQVIDLVESADAEMEDEDEDVHVGTSQDKSLEECPSSFMSCDADGDHDLPFYQGPSGEIMENVQYKITQQVHITNAFEATQPIEATTVAPADLSNQWNSNNQYDPYMGFTWDQDWNAMA